MNGISARYWWILGLQGVVAIIYGIVAFAWPLLTLGILVILFGIFSLVHGISAIADAVRAKSVYRLWWLQLVSGIIGIAVGVVAILWSGLTALALLYLMVAWALVIGVAEIVQAFAAETPWRARWPLGLTGLLFIVFAALLLALGPAGGLLALAWLIGVHAIAAGVFLLIAAFHLRGAGTGEAGSLPRSA